MKKINKKHMCKVTLVVVLSLVLLTQAFAWYISAKKLKMKEISGSIGFVGAYFAGGDGTEEHPYLLTTSDHFYNLAWLQYMGIFTERTYFKLDNDITMDSEYAVPPIGTTTYPFVGVFDGNEKTISNLWVSSREKDWEERPLGVDIDAVGKDIGVFGNISVLDDNAGSASRFYLKDVKVTDDRADSNVGLIAGNVDGNLSYVGVKTGTIELNNSDGSGAINVLSEYSLVGKLSNGVDWTDRPGTEGKGNLEIFPQTDHYLNPDGTTSTKAFETVAAGAVRDVVNAPKIDFYGEEIYSAKYYGSLNGGSTKPPPKGAYYYNLGDCNFENLQNGYKQLNANKYTSEAINPADKSFNQGFISKFFTNNTLNSTAIATIKPNGAPQFSGDHPTNCIWFKPHEDGMCCITFIRQNNSSNEYISIYRYKRKQDASGKMVIDETTLEEVVLCLQSSNGLGNGAVIYFDLPVTSTEGYEYAIGNSKKANSGGGTAAFTYLVLGKGEDGSGTQSGVIKEITRIDYMDNVPVQSPALNIWDENYEVHKSLYAFEGLVNAGSEENIIYDTLNGQVTVGYDGNRDVTVENVYGK